MVSRFVEVFKRRKIHRGCQEVRDSSSGYLDGELEQATADKVKSHLDRCGPCTAFLNTLKATVSLLRASPSHQAPGDLRQRIREALRKGAG